MTINLDELEAVARRRFQNENALVSSCGMDMLALIAELRRARECIETLEAKSLRLSNANDGEWVEIPAGDWDAALTAHDQEGAS